MKNRKLVIGLLVMLAFVVSSFTYAYWAGTVTQASNTPGTVTIGEGGASTVTLNFGSASASDLVPTSVDPASDEAVLTFNVEWDEDVANTADADGVLTVAIESYTLGALSEAQIDAMFSITITAGQGDAITMNGSVVTVQVTVVFQNAPATTAIYDEVANGNLEITISVTVGSLS